MNAEAQCHTILLVDDTAENLAVVAEHLTACGYRILVAQDGEEALARSELVRPDLILLDVMLPGIDGFEVCRRLRSHDQTRDIPVIFMTALTDESDKVHGFEAGGVDYVTKPVQVYDVLARVRTHLALRAAHARQARQNTQLQALAAFRDGQNQILEMISTDLPLDDILTGLIELIESQSERMWASILLLDEAGRQVCHCVAPSLPPAFSQGVLGLVIGPRVGSCGTAMYRGEQVIVSDILTDPLWDGHRAALAPFGLRACWSTPILAANGGVLGSFAMYYRDVRSPGQAEQRLITVATHIVRIAVQRRRAHEHDQHMARHDPLTGLPNRLLLKDRLLQAMAQTGRNGQLLALLFVDLDHFKRVNDTHGHTVGDRLLLMVAERMLGCLREGDSVARLGGDEFVVVLPGLRESDRAAMVAEKLLAALAMPFEIGGHALRIGGSIGISLYPVDSDDADALLRAADTAMYEAKHTGRGGYQFFRPELNEATRLRMALAHQIAHALEQDQFVLYYQPQVDLQSGRVVACEALLRWRHPDLGLLTPDKFIHLVQDTDLMIALGRWTLLTVCRQCRAWQLGGFPAMRVAVNLCERQLRHGADLVRAVGAALRAAGLSPPALELEICESALREDSETKQRTLADLKRLGVGLALDDFGNGYASLLNLRRFAVHRIKVARELLDDVATRADCATIVRSMVLLARELDMGCVAEGVETPAQLAFLRSLPFTEAQGFLFSPPVDAGRLEEMLVAGRARRDED